jgi:pseudo-rSAM protein
MLLYNTQTGASIETENELCLQLVREVYQPANLGVIELLSCYTENATCIAFISKIIEDDSGKMIEIEDVSCKPVNLLPILSLKNDVDKFIKDGSLSLVGNGILDYLSELNIFINNTCQQACTLCSTYHKHVRCCFKEENTHILLPEDVNNMLHQSIYSNLKRVNILGGNISLYPYWQELSKVLSKYDFEYHYWINEKNINTNPYFSYTDVIFSTPIEKERINQVIKKYKNEGTCYHFLIENKHHYEIVEESISESKISKFNIIPIYTGNNLNFFKTYVFSDKEDILSSIKSMREIFCNKKLNSIFFGILNILPNGTVKANINASSLGNVHKNTILKAIHKELLENSSWRQTRKSGACGNCLYKYLCPPPSNYEVIIGKTNLCNIKKFILQNKYRRIFYQQ